MAPPGAGEPKTQMITPRGTDGDTAPTVTPTGIISTTVLVVASLGVGGAEAPAVAAAVWYLVWRVAMAAGWAQVLFPGGTSYNSSWKPLLEVTAVLAPSSNGQSLSSDSLLGRIAGASDASPDGSLGSLMFSPGGSLGL